MPSFRRWRFEMKLSPFAIIAYCRVLGWLQSVGSQVVYELDCKEPQAVLYVVPIQSILGKLPVVPVCDSGTIPQ